MSNEPASIEEQISAYEAERLAALGDASQKTSERHSDGLNITPPLHSNPGFDATAAKTFDAIRDKTFTLTQVARASNLSEDTAVNLTSKQGLCLFSENPGRGKLRKFCAADAYMFALAARLGDLTRNAKQVAEVINRHCIWNPVFTQMPDQVRNEDEPATKRDYDIVTLNYLDSVSRDAFNGVTAFWSRNTGNPFYLIIVSNPEHKGEYCSFLEQDPLGNWRYQQDAALFVNLTILFSQVDRALLEFIEKSEG